MTEADIITALGAQKSEVSVVPVESMPETLFDLPMREARDHFEKAYLEHHLKKTGGNVGDVAQTVEMERTHLYRKLKSLGIDIKNLKVS